MYVLSTIVLNSGQTMTNLSFYGPISVAIIMLKSAVLRCSPGTEWKAAMPLLHSAVSRAADFPNDACFDGEGSAEGSGLQAMDWFKGKNNRKAPYLMGKYLWFPVKIFP
jgi:hypothetical protein